MSTLRASLSSSSSSRQWKNDVFLSFRNQDTGLGFADHLYNALRQKGILIVTGGEELEEGDSISSEHSKLIEGSKLAIVIFSKNYASSTWCLNELEKIVQCKSDMAMLVLPIFYDVHPSEIRTQSGPLALAFAAYEELYKENLEKVQTWRSALNEVAHVGGWNVNNHR